MTSLDPEYSGSNRIEMLDARSERELHNLPVPNGTVNSLALGPNGSSSPLPDYYGTVKLFDLLQCSVE